MLVTNTTSLYIVLNNVYVPEPGSADDSENEEDNYSHRVELRPLAERSKASKQVSLVMEIEGERVLGVERASSILPVAESLDPSKKYKVRITYMGCHFDCSHPDEAVEFEGVWLDRPASLKTVLSSFNSITQAAVGKMLPHNESYSDTLHQDASTRALHRPVIELVTAEPDCDLASMANWRGDTTATLAEERVGNWYNIIGARLSAGVVIVPTRLLTMMPSEDSAETVKHLFFRSGPVDSVHFSRPWAFATYQPSVLVLQLGLVDFVEFFREKKNANKHSVSRFTQDYVDAATNFIRTIRANAYPFHPPSNADTSNDGSYIYNSAPSTLPIFLIVPFSARHKFVTKKLTLHKFISDALSQVTSVLQAEGDKSTYWMDSTGWLDPREDFVREDDEDHGDLAPTRLTAAANIKVASLLAEHLCPYVRPDNSPLGQIFGDCAFDRYDNYLGNVYLPTDVEFDRAMLERKIERIKQTFNLGAPALRDWERGEWFLHKIKK